MASESTTAAGSDRLIGQTIAERYTVEGLLGEGGVGQVYRAKHLALGRPVALKVLQTEHEASDQLRERFRREAEALAALAHPHIVGVTDFGMHGDSPFLVMELLEGCSLSELLREERVPPAKGIAIVHQVLSALGYAHARGVIHRDLKPQNVFVRRLQGGTFHATVLDFGLARFVSSSRPGQQLTRVGQVIGTPAYMAPEQASGDTDAIDARTDVYAAGLVLFEVLCGRRPFPGNDPGKLMKAHLLEDPPSLAAADPELEASPELQAVVSRALAKNQRDRYADANEMLAALDAIDPATVKRGAAPRRTFDPESMATANTLAASPASKSRQTPAPPKRSPFFLVIAVAVPFALACIAALAAVWILWPDEPEPRTDVRPPPPEPPPEPIAPPPEAPALRDPFSEPLPERIAPLYALVQRGRWLSRSQVRVVRDWGREDESDVRSYLLLGHSYTNERSLSYAFPEYEQAMQRDRAARGYPEMLPDLIEMALSNALATRAANAIVEWYGAEAIPAVDAALEGARRDERPRLERLRARLAAN